MVCRDLKKPLQHHEADLAWVDELQIEWEKPIDEFNQFMIYQIPSSLFAELQQRGIGRSLKSSEQKIN